MHELQVTGFLAIVKAQVLEHHDLAVLERERSREGILTGDLLATDDRNGTTKQLNEAHGHGHHRELTLEMISLGTAQMACDNDASIMVEEVTDGRQRLADSRIIHDGTFIQRTVEVHAY